MSGFGEGFAEGFANSYAQSYDAAERRKLFLEEQSKKKTETVNRLRPMAAEKLGERETLKTQLTFLESKGLPKEVVDAFYEDPEALEAAYNFAREKGSQLTPEQLGQIYKVIPTGKDETRPWEDRLEEEYSVYEQFFEGQVTDPEAFLEQAVRPRTRTAVVESNMPKDPKEEGLTEQRRRTWNAQKDVVEEAAISFARAERDRLDRMLRDGTGDKEVQARRDFLEASLGRFSTDDNARSAILEEFRELSLQRIASDDRYPADFLAGILENPFLFKSQAPEEEAGQPTVAAPEGAVLIAEGINPETNKFTRIYKMPDGNLEYVVVE